MPDTGSQSPVGTPAELNAVGAPLSEWASCAPPQRGFGKACPEWHRCQFRFREPDGRGGFRGKGPQNIGIFKHNRETGASREDITDCYHFMHYMYDQNQGGKDAVRLYDVIAYEGEDVTISDEVAADPNNNRSGDVRMKVVVKKVTVPRFPRPGEPGSKIGPTARHAQEALERHRARFASQARESALGVVREETGDEHLPPPEMAPLDEPAVLPAPSPPVTRRRGRPPRS